MEDRLSAGAFVGLHHRHAIGMESSIDESRHVRRGTQQRGRARGRDVEQRPGVGARNDERMALGRWGEVEKCHGTFVFVHDVGRPKSAHDVAERARWIEGHSAVVRSTSIVAASSGAPIRSQTSSVRSSNSKSKKAQHAFSRLARSTAAAITSSPSANRSRTEESERMTSTTFSTRNVRHSSPRPACSEADNVQAIGSDVTKWKLVAVFDTCDARKTARWRQDTVRRHKGVHS